MRPARDDRQPFTLEALALHFERCGPAQQDLGGMQCRSCGLDLAEARRPAHVAYAKNLIGKMPPHVSHIGEARQMLAALEDVTR